MYKKLGICVFLLGYSTSLLAGDVHEFSLENGLQLIVKQDHRAPVVVSQVWYKVGASYEPEGKTGISHILEHMMFKGTKKHPPGEFSRIMAANGASENAFTGSDYTAYFQTIEKSRLPLSFELEADRMLNVVFIDEEFQKERKVVLEERRTRTEDKPISLMYEHFVATAYQNSPYHHPVIGWMSDIKNYTVEDLKVWYKRWYAPNNATVVVVGDVDPQAVFALAKKYFGPLKPSKIIPPYSRPEVKQLGMKQIMVKLPAKIPYLILGYKTPVLNTIAPENRWEVYALDVLSYILDGGNSSRLSKNLVRGQQIAASISVNYDIFGRLTELFTFSGTPTSKHTISDLQSALNNQIKQLKTTLVTADELKRVKTKILSSKIYELDSIFYQGMKIGLLETIGLDWRLFESYLDNITTVTAEQVQTVAKKYLVDQSLTVGILEPKEKK
ncbi:M16 family metallopeptidase [Candidatus Marithrix sp. Canyon 246]|uniref:M16 family metallopeptidase n=1 Tax=Candidatus Marithrix sp. Canyon 246 TaxID=1827136 RepID=UPI00084A1131|nr:pitrilysin family protein [Candidatus Marithrix sp. Canyon 246]